MIALMQISPNTFTQVKHWLDTELGEYASAYSLTTPHESEHPVAPFSYKDMKQRYPGALFAVFANRRIVQISQKITRYHT